MTKTDLLRGVSKKLNGCSQKDVDAVISAYSEFVLETLSANKEDTVKLPGIGTFSVKHVPERRGISQMGEKKEWVKPAHDEIAFKITKSVKELS